MYNYFSAILALAFLFASFSNLKAQSSIETEIDNRLHIADSLRRRIKFSDAWNQLALISSLEEKMSNTQLAEYYKLVGATQVGLGKTKIALENYSKSKATLKQLKSSKSKIDFVNLYTLEGTVYNKTGDYKKAKATFLDGITEAQNLSGKDSLVALKYLYNNLADTYELLGQIDNSVSTSNSVLSIINHLGDEKSISAGVANNTLGICYRQLGRYKLAEEHYNKAAEIFSVALGPNSRYTHAALANAATSIDDYGDAEKAIPILMRKLKIYLEDPGIDQLYLINTYSTLGWIYSRIGDYDKSLDAFERALGKMRGIGSTKKDLEIRLLRRIGQVEVHQQKLDQAELHLLEAEALENKHQVLTTGEIIRLNSTLENFYRVSNNASKLFEYTEKSYNISSQDSSISFNLRTTAALNYVDQLISISNFKRANAIISSTSNYIQENKQDASLAVLTDVFAMIDVLRGKLARNQGQTADAFKEGLDGKLEQHVLKILKLTASTPGKKNQKYACTSCFGVSDVLQTLVNLHLDAHRNQIDKDGDHLNKALAALDIKKRFVTNIWNNKYFSKLSPPDREQAIELRQRIAAYDLMIYENKENTTLAQKRNTLFLDSILALRPRLTKLIAKLEAKPIDFNSTFDFSQLDDNLGVLVYHQHNDKLHQISLTKNGISLNTISNAGKIRSDIESYSAFCNTESLGFSESLKTLEIGQTLYDLLVPSELQSKDRIAILQGYPTEELPFAALLTNQIPRDAKGFRDIDFAVKKHSFSYHQSLSDFFDSQVKKHYSNKIKLTALAPSQLSASPMASTDTKKPLNTSLAYAVEEAELLTKKYKGRLLTGREADFTGFTNAFKSSNIVHIASHATSNFDAGEYSYIIITDTSSLSGERLYARTISELELPTNLVVLGACESGSGKLSSGEGTISLANVFLNAGSQAVLHTGWRVEDKSSQEILLNFYEAFTEQAPLDEALGLAQQKYLESAGGQYLHPFYWAPFEVSGKLSPFESSWNYLFYIGFTLIVLIGLFFFWKRR